MRLSSSRVTSLTHRPQQDFPLWDKAGSRPSLDLQFADRRDLVDATTGSNLVDFTRASSGTYVGSDGLIKTATTNLLLRSEEFGDATAWTPSNGTVSPNTDTAPDGTLSADKFIPDAALGNFKELQQNVSIITGTVYTFSQFVKAAGYRYIQLVGNGSIFGTFAVNFDLQDGVETSLTAGSSTVVNRGIHDYGNGWYRVFASVTCISTTSGRMAVNVIPAEDSARGVSWSSDGSSGVLFWGAQLEQSTTVGEYIPTTSTINSAPRFDHDPTTGESLGLVVEESRTNLLLQSEDFSTTWGSSGLLSFGSGSIANAATAPNNTLTADKITEDTTTGGHVVIQSVTGLPDSTLYTASCFAKADGRNWVALTIVDKTGALNRVWFNLVTGQQGTTNGTVSAFSAVQYPNDWWHLNLAVSTSAGASVPNVRISMAAADDIASYTGDGTSGIYVWGAQLEAGSFPTSYIPTTDSTVTRAADVASISGSNFSSWYRQDEFTAYVDATLLSEISATSKHLFMVSDGSANNRIAIYGPSTGQLSAFRQTSSGANNDLIGNVTSGVRFKVAGAFASNDASVSLNGITPNVLPNNIMPSGVDRFGLWRTYAGPDPSNAHIARVTYWPQRLPNDTLQTITQ